MRWRASSRLTARVAIRPPVDSSRVDAFLERLGRGVGVEATLYLVGGSSAVLIGWRETTRDIDLHVEPDEATGSIGDAIAQLKDELAVNVEFASPVDFLPALPSWRERSPFIKRVGKLTIRHFDFYSQALAKVRRGIAADDSDVAALLDAGLIRAPRAWELYEAIVPEMRRFPAIYEPSFRSRMISAFGPPPV